MTSPAKKIIVGVIAVVLVVIAVGIWIGIVRSGWKAAIQSGSDTYAVQNFKTIAAAEAQYFKMHNRAFGTFDQLVKEGLLDVRFSGQLPIIDDYRFTLKVMPPNSGQSVSYMLQADPLSEGGAKRHFYLDSTSGTIHVNAGQPASVTDSPLGE
jgi:Tfp pilus assembly protein PilE